MVIHKRFGNMNKVEKDYIKVIYELKNRQQSYELITDL